MFKRWITLAVVFFMFVPLTTETRGNEGYEFLVEPNHVKVGFFYNGQKINVRMKTPIGYDVVIRVTGEEKDVLLKKKGKKFGFLWMNVGDLKFESIPSLYMIRSSVKFTELADRKILNRLGIGYEALEDGINYDAGSGEEELYFGELIELKEKEKLFSTAEGGVEISDLGNGFQEASDSFILPPKAPVGEYKVDFFSFKNGTGTLLESSFIKLEYAPATFFITSMARNHGLVYGVLASVIAIMAGLVTGLIFKGKTSH